MRRVMDHQLTLVFFDNELIETDFTHPLLEAPLCAIRGKTSGAYKAHGTFQWTVAVQALSIFFARCVCASPAARRLAGHEGSPAASLDYAISKEPIWLIEMLGADRTGCALARRLLRRTNPNRKRPGPVVLSLNENLLKVECIRLIIDGEQAGPEEAAELYRVLQESWPGARVPERVECRA